MPFGPSDSGCLRCQNRITGGPRMGTARYSKGLSVRERIAVNQVKDDLSRDADNANALFGKIGQMT
ncbi:hypothetical protein CP970_14135 [Streptomyces kanamyceticus]|uniref:Uncharacterized protein n=1 Tax=Streptomyces kanamyceticus TaxID=1967 RepID=A0A5J6GBA8_STRKN|nr:hypothetical protein CP970_14135 [Streptomyces kanamyceticus]